MYRGRIGVVLVPVCVVNVWVYDVRVRVRDVHVRVRICNVHVCVPISDLRTAAASVCQLTLASAHCFDRGNLA